ncbi:MAG TPA: efflux RND transporter periplasmic adaptor subunit [Burkholderiales bacterium]|nr:efflux RND transporter periplasmic adaptor subunit [Burkholderiales bacterium]
MRIIFLSALLVLLAGCSPSGGQEKGAAAPGSMPPQEVTVATVTPQSLPVNFEYIGQTAGSREVEVRARVTGILLSRNFQEGTAVKKGQSLYDIDPAPFQAAAARAEADVAAALARAEQARRNLARLRPLHAEKAVSQKELDDALSAEAIADADVKGARARLQEARLNLGYTKVESPASGLAGRSMQSEGTLVSGPQVLLTTITQIHPIWVNFGIPDNEQARLRKDADAGRLEMPKDGRLVVELRLADGSTYAKAGKLNFSDVRISSATGTQEARAELPNPDGVLRPGQFVRVLLKGASRPNAMTIPQRAVLEGPQGKFVYVVNDKGQAEPRPIEAGEWVGDAWIINSGLKPGERVILDGVMKLGPGAPVRIADATKPAAKPAAQGAKPAAGK